MITGELTEKLRRDQRAREVDERHRTRTAKEVEEGPASFEIEVAPGVNIPIGLLDQYHDGLDMCDGCGARPDIWSTCPPGTPS